MKTLLICILGLCASASAQVTANISWDYDMSTTGVSGSTLTDQSGAGHNGTLVASPTVAATGITFNGSSQYVSGLPQFQNGDFTVIGCLAGTTSGNGAMWYEGDNNQNDFMRIYAKSGGSISRINSSGGDSGVFGPNFTDWSSLRNEFHCFYLQRNTSGTVGRATTGMIDQPYRAVASITGSPNFGSTNCTDLGAQSTGASCDVSHNSFFTGVMVRSVGYTRALTATELQTEYSYLKTQLAAKGVFLGDSINRPVSGPSYSRQGIVLTGGENSLLYETTNCQLIANPCFKDWYSNSGGNGIAYAESPDATSAWTVHATVLSGHVSPTVVKNGSTYLMYVDHGTARYGASFDQYTSTDGITWTLGMASVLSKGVSGWDSTGVDNPQAVIDADCGLLCVFYEATGSGNVTIGCATTPDGTTFTKCTANPIIGNLSAQGPFAKKINGTWYMWAGGPGADGVAASYVGLIRVQSSILNSLWVQSSTYALSPGVTDVNIGDPSWVEVNGKVYLIAATTNDGQDKLYIFNGTASQLVLGSEGAITSAP